MTSYETAIRTINFASRHSVSGPTTQTKHNVLSSRKYLLRQTLPTTQTLELASTLPSRPVTATPSPSYSIFSHPKGGFMHRRPHLVITKHEGGLNIHLAEVRFESRGYGTIIAFKAAGVSQALALKCHHGHQYKVSIDGTDHWWQPLGPGHAVLELTNGAGKKVALFVYAEEVAQRRASAPASLEHFQTENVGEIHVLDELEGVQMILEQILCTAIVVVAREKLWVSNGRLVK